MPPAVSALSHRLVNAIRLPPTEAKQYPHPVYVDTEQVSGYFKADRLRELIAQRDDLSYMTKTVLNEDRDGIPGFTFERIQQGEQTLGEFLKALPVPKADEPGGALREAGSAPR